MWDYMVSECTAGKYGLHCEMDCGKCSNTSKCFHVNGTCPSGCSSGFQGHTCKGDLHNKHKSEIQFLGVNYKLLYFYSIR